MDNKELVIRFFVEGYINHNYDFIMECMAEDYIDHSPAGARSNADAVGILKIVEGQFSDLKIEVLDVFGEEDMVATRILYQGIHAGTCMGIPATGKHISFEALENFKVVWTARLLNRGVIGQIKKLKRNFDKFQSYGEIESNRRFEFAYEK